MGFFRCGRLFGREPLRARRRRGRCPGPCPVSIRRTLGLAVRIEAEEPGQFFPLRRVPVLPRIDGRHVPWFRSCENPRAFSRVLFVADLAPSLKKTHPHWLLRFLRAVCRIHLSLVPPKSEF